MNLFSSKIVYSEIAQIIYSRLPFWTSFGLGWLVLIGATNLPQRRAGIHFSAFWFYAKSRPHKKTANLANVKVWLGTDSCLIVVVFLTMTASAMVNDKTVVAVQSTETASYYCCHRNNSKLSNWEICIAGYEKKDAFADDWERGWEHREGIGDLYISWSVYKSC